MLKNIDSININYDQTYDFYTNGYIRRIDLPLECKVELNYQNGDIYAYMSFLKEQLPFEIDWQKVAETYHKDKGLPEKKSGPIPIAFLIGENEFKLSFIHYL